MSNGLLAQAVVLALRSDVMLIAAIVITGSTYLLGHLVRSRAVDPEIRWRQALSSRTRFSNRSVAGAGTAATLIIVALLGLTGALTLSLTGNAPSPLLALGPAVLAAAIAVSVAARICSTSSTRSILAARGARLVASSLFTEVSAALAVVITVAVVLHTEGLTAVSIIEVIAISLATRLAVRLSPWPGGLGIADATLLIPLTWIGVPVHVGLSALLIWRAGSLLAATTAVLAARVSMNPGSANEQPSTDRARLLHRALFTAISLLPARVRDAVRRTVFDALFALSQDPWDYQTSAYERRKRDLLLAAVPRSVRRLVEVGCAEGHNLVALAHLRPDVTLIGLDVSATAATLARRQTAELANIHILGPDDAARLAAIGAQGIDCLILSEVLYYMGSWQSIRRNLDPLRDVMEPDCSVIMVHGAADASSLHRRAARALGLHIVQETVVDDPARPYVVTVAQTSPTQTSWTQERTTRHHAIRWS